MQTSTKHKREFQGPITSWRGGLNKVQPPPYIDPEELLDATNWFYSPTTGYPSTRTGLALYSASSIGFAITGIYPYIQNGTLTILVTAEDGNIYYLDATKTPILIGKLSGSERPSFATLAGKAVICSGGVLQVYDPIGGLVDTTSPAMSFIIGQSTNVGTTTYARIWGCGNSTFRSRVFASGAGDPTNWNYGDLTEAGPKYFDVGYNDGQDAAGLIQFMGDLFISKRATDGSAKSIYRAQIWDVVVNWACTPISRFHGSLSPHLMKELNNNGFILDSDGPKQLSVITAFPASIPFDVKPTTAKVSGEIAAFSDGTGFIIHDPLYQILMIKPKLLSDTFYCYDYSHDRWTYFKYALDIRAGVYADGKMLFGGADGNLYEYDYSSDTDNGTRYQISIETKWFDIFAMDEEIVKERFIDILGQTEGTLAVTYKNKGDIVYSKLFAFGSSWWTWDKVNSLTPAQWTESLNKSVINTVRHQNILSGDFVSIAINVTSGLCALGPVRIRTAATGRK